MLEEINVCPVCGSVRFTEVLKCTDQLISKSDFGIRECVNCRVRMTNPRPDETKISFFYDSPEYISHDSEKHDIFSRIYTIARGINIRKKYRIVQRFTKGNELLDVGCGTGEFLHYCQQNKMNCQGVEPNVKARSFGLKHYFLNIEESLDNIHGEKKFDTITLWHVLEHFHDPFKTLNQIGDILKDSGVIIIALPNYCSFDARYYKEFWAAYDVPRHLFHFNSGAFLKLAAKTGFICTKIYSQKMDAFYISVLSEKYKKKKFHLFSGFFIGLLSNILALFTNNGTSSQIFILSKKIM